MEKQVAQLVDKTWTKFQHVDESRRLLIALAGIPGSGKTTLAALIGSGLNKAYHADYHQRFPNAPKADEDHPDPSQPDVAFVVPLDGYHLTRQQLSELPNAEEAVFRRGAAFTFDADAYSKLVEKLRNPLEAGTATIYAPSFDHAVKDPVEDNIAIPPTARIIIFEGLYVAMDRPGWRDAAKMMDELWFIDTPFAIAEARVTKRNFAAGLSPTLEESLARTRASDMRNGREVVNERLPVQEVIKSVEDAEWKSEEMERLEQEIEDEAAATAAAGNGDEDGGGGRRQRVDSIAALAEAGAGW